MGASLKRIGPLAGAAAKGAGGPFAPCFVRKSGEHERHEAAVWARSPWGVELVLSAPAGFRLQQAVEVTFAAGEHGRALRGSVVALDVPEAAEGPRERECRRLGQRLPPRLCVRLALAREDGAVPAEDAPTPAVGPGLALGSVQDDAAFRTVLRLRRASMAAHAAGPAIYDARAALVVGATDGRLRAAMRLRLVEADEALEGEGGQPLPGSFPEREALCVVAGLVVERSPNEAWLAMLLLRRACAVTLRARRRYLVWVAEPRWLSLARSLGFRDAGVRVASGRGFDQDLWWLVADLQSTLERTWRPKLVWHRGFRQLVALLADNKRIRLRWWHRQRLRLLVPVATLLTWLSRRF